MPKEFLPTHENIKKRIRDQKYVFDVSSTFDIFGKEIYDDIVHVKQRANDAMGIKIAGIVAEELKLRKMPAAK